MNLDRLEELARCATPGPWRDGVGHVFDRDKRLIAHVMSTRGDFDDEAPNCAYIAAASPDVMLRMLAAIRAANHYLAMSAGAYDCIDNDGERYQSQDMANSERALRAALEELEGK